MAGKKNEALEIIKELQDLSAERYISPYCVALIYASMRKPDLAIEWLQKAVQERVSELVYLKVDPYLDKLRSDPRFTDLLYQVGLGS